MFETSNKFDIIVAIVLAICLILLFAVTTSIKLESARYDIVLNDGTYIPASSYQSDGDYIMAYYKGTSKTIHKKEIKEIKFKG